MKKGCVYIGYQDGIKRPTISTITEKEAIEKIEGAKLIFEKTICIDKEYVNSFRTTFINYRVFNKKPKKEKGK